MKIITSILLLLLLSISLYGQVLKAPTNLTCDLLREPSEAVITNNNPSFSWVFPQAGIKQKAYRILVTDSPFKLGDAISNYWDSGIIYSNKSTNILYEGNPLVPNSVYWWQVKVWSDTNLESVFSDAQQFNTGDFNRSNLDYPGQSRWIEIEKDNWVSEDKQSASFQYFEPEYTNIQKNKFFAAFEKSVIGILNLTISSEIDSLPITIDLGERRNDDFTVNKNQGKSNIGYEQVKMYLNKGTYEYIVKLAERKPSKYLHSQKLAPHLPEVMPFRFVEIEGNSELFTIQKINQAALIYYFEDSTSSFACSNENLNKVWDLCKYTLKATPFLGVYADGNRERMPYEADAYIQQLSHYVVDREYSISRYTINFLLDHASWPTEWQMHVVMMAWEYYMNTGDKSIFEERYEDLRRKTLIDLAEENKLISTRTDKVTREFLDKISFPGPVKQFRDIVDWPHGVKKNTKKASNQSPLKGGETDGYVFTDYNTVVNAFHNRSLVLMSKIADVVGNKDDSDFLRKRSEEHKQQFFSTFFDAKKGIFNDGDNTDHSSLHANMFPLAFGLVAEENIKTVADFVESRGMACSVYGAQYLLEALFNAGKINHALDLMTSESKRSWINMINVGSSMTTEAWDEFYKPNLTWNHAWGTAPTNIIARKLFGIEPLEPCYARFRISPEPGYLDTLSIKLPILMGEIKCNLKKNENSWLLEISVPGNTDAELLLPDTFSKVVANNNEIIPISKSSKAVELKNIFKFSSGTFLIRASK